MDVAERIHEANQRFMEAIRAGDSATMPSLDTSDATILPPNSDAVSGGDAIVEYWQAFFDLGIAAAQPERWKLFRWASTRSRSANTRYSEMTKL